jgi:hypothetical protein
MEPMEQRGVSLRYGFSGTGSIEDAERSIARAAGLPRAAGISESLHAGSVGAMVVAVLIVVIVFLTVWGAGVFPVSVCICAALLAAAGARVLISRGETVARMPSRTGWLALLILTYILLQLLPVPRVFEGLTGSRRREQNVIAREAIDKAADLGLIEANSARFSLTRNRAGTLRTIMLFICAVSAAIIGASLPERTRAVYLAFLIALMAVVSVLGFLHQWVLPAHKTIWWFWTVPHGRPVGCFVSRTHHAGYIALAAPLALASAIGSLGAKRIARSALYTVLFVVISFGVLTSLSRGAAVAWAASCIVVLASSLVYSSLPRRVLVVAIALVAVICAVVAVVRIPKTEVTNVVVDRLSTLEEPLAIDSAKSRFGVWRDSGSLIRDFAILGVGANGFRMIYPGYRTNTERKSFTHAENEYVELAVDGGLLGMLLVLGLAVSLGLAFACNARDGVMPSVLVPGLLGSLAVVLVHNAVDFPLHAPVYSIVFASLVGIAVGRAPGQQDEDMSRRRRVRLGAGILAVCATAATVSLLPGIMIAYELDSPDVIVEADAELLARGLEGAPTSWQTWYHFGATLGQPGNRPSNLLAEQCFSRATSYDPNNYRLWEAVGHRRLGMGNEAGADEAFDRMQRLRSWKRRPTARGGGY